MKEWLLELLICPSCLPEERPLQISVDERRQDDIDEGMLSCSRCRGTYPIREGVAYLDPAGLQTQATSRYETPALLASYLWSHYGDLLPDPEASSAYSDWAGLLPGGGGSAIDLGAAVGRMSFELGRRCDRVVGVDNSVSFIRAARALQQNRQVDFSLPMEGSLSRPVSMTLPWPTAAVEFIVGDALALPFRSVAFDTLASLNLIDKVPRPLTHLREMNRVAGAKGAQLLFSDPFSWSTEVAAKGEWLGGKLEEPFAGRGMDNVATLLQGEHRHLWPAWQIDGRGHVWWKIRTHANHFELIRSCYIKASR